LVRCGLPLLQGPAHAGDAQPTPLPARRTDVAQVVAAALAGANGDIAGVNRANAALGRGFASRTVATRLVVERFPAMGTPGADALALQRQPFPAVTTAWHGGSAALSAQR